MTRRFDPTTLILAASVLLAAPAFAGDHGAGFGVHELSAETRRELGAARAATARYHHLESALADGYVDIDVFVPGQGFHYLNADLLDAEFEPERPEILVYALNESGRQLRLVAVEYAVPLALAEEAPSGFTGDSDTWDVNEEFQLWTLHAWIWRQNPHGVFAEFNPRVP